MAGPVVIGINGSFNIGQDVSVTMQHNESGVIIPTFLLGHLMEVDATQDDTILKVIPITNGGRPKLNTVYYGWTGHMMFTRYNGNLTALLAALEKNFYNFRQMSHFTIQATVVNRDGTTDQYTWTNAVLSRGTFGNWRADKETDQRIEFMSEAMEQTGGAGALIPLL